MQALKKTFVLALCTLFLAQSTAFAQAATQTNTQKSLAQYQQQAKEDIEKAPWIANNAKWLLALGGVSLGALVTGIIQQNRINRIKDIQTQDLYKFLQNTTARNAADAAAPLSARASQIKVFPSYDVPGPYLPAEFWIKPSKKAQRAMMKRDIQAALSGVDITKYMGLFDPAVPYTDRMVLRVYLSQEPWLTSAPASQKKAFMELIDELSLASQMGKKDVVTARVLSSIKTNFKESPSLLRRANVLVSKLGKTSNLALIGIVVALGASAQQANAQKMADRINRNFDLFLNATEEELAEMEQNEEVRNVCIRGAEVLHSLSQMNPAEKDFMQGLLSQEKNNIPSSKQLLEKAAQ